MKNFKPFICAGCNKEVQRTSPSQRYCGGRKIKNSCSYKNQRRLGILSNERDRERYLARIKRQIEKRRTKTQQKRLGLRFRLLELFSFTCHYCGRTPPEVTLEVDHILPKSKGGLDEMENYTVACRDCNLGKSDFIINEFKMQKPILRASIFRRRPVCGKNRF